LSAKLIERRGFDGVYVSGAVLSADLGLLDIGLTTLTEVAAHPPDRPGHRVARAG
jgi:methylisocitrate lyase